VPTARRGRSARQRHHRHQPGARHEIVLIGTTLRSPRPIYAKLAPEVDPRRLPVIVEIILERVTNISMGTELDNITEFEDLAEHREHAPTSVALLD